MVFERIILVVFLKNKLLVESLREGVGGGLLAGARGICIRGVELVVWDNRWESGIGAWGLHCWMDLWGAFQLEASVWCSSCSKGKPKS